MSSLKTAPVTVFQQGFYYITKQCVIEISVFLELTFFFFAGAKSGGTAGFFKGLGKGVVGVVARPAGGLVDFASSTLEGIKG